MATKMEHLHLEIAHYEHFRNYLPGAEFWSQHTVRQLLALGGIQVSTLFEQALAAVGGHEVVSLDKGDLYFQGHYSDAKLSTVRTSNYGRAYSAPVTNIFNKTGTLRVQVYERKKNKFYYFAIPRRAYIEIPKSSNIEIPFELDGTPRRVPVRKVNVNWWNYEVKTWAEMAVKYCSKVATVDSFSGFHYTNETVKKEHKMRYPEDFTADDIMEFEYEYNRLRDMDEGLGLWAVNAEIQIIAAEQQESEHA